MIQSEAETSADDGTTPNGLDETPEADAVSSVDVANPGDDITTDAGETIDQIADTAKEAAGVETETDAPSAAAADPQSPEQAEDNADAAPTAVEETAEDAVQLINDLQDINFLLIAGIVLGTWFAIALIRRVFPYLAERGPSQLRLFLLGAVPIARLLLLLTAILWTIPLVFNVTFQNFLVIAGAASVAIGFAFKDYASSLIAGIVAIIERPYRPGDWVRISDDYGEVTHVGMRAIRIRTPADDTVTVPHDRIWSDNISNSNDGERTLLCVADFFVAPDHDAEPLRQSLRDVALTSCYLSYQHPVAVMLSETPHGTHYKVKAYPFDMRDQFRFVSDLTVRGKRAIKDCGASEVCVAAVGGLAG